MRYTPFLQDLIRDYNNSPEELENECQLIAETTENRSKRLLGEPMLFNLDNERGDFWVKKDGSDPSIYWLMPKTDTQINPHNFSTIEHLFECKYFLDENYTQTYELVRPARLKLITSPKNYFEHEARGILRLPQSVLKLTKFSDTQFFQSEVIRLQSELQELKDLWKEQYKSPISGDNNSSQDKIIQDIYQKVHISLKNKILSDIISQLTSPTPKQSQE